MWLGGFPRRWLVPVLPCARLRHARAWWGNKHNGCGDLVWFMSLARALVWLREGNFKHDYAGNHGKWIYCCAFRHRCAAQPPCGPPHPIGFQFAIDDPHPKLCLLSSIVMDGATPRVLCFMVLRQIWFTKFLPAARSPKPWRVGCDGKNLLAHGSLSATCGLWSIKFNLWPNPDASDQRQPFTGTGTNRELCCLVCCGVSNIEAFM